jgi:hypothetical protein
MLQCGIRRGERPPGHRPSNHRGRIVLLKHLGLGCAKTLERSAASAASTIGAQALSGLVYALIAAISAPEYP